MTLTTLECVKIWTACQLPQNENEAKTFGSWLAAVQLVNLAYFMLTKGQMIKSDFDFSQVTNQQNKHGSLNECLTSGVTKKLSCIGVKEVYNDDLAPPVTAAYIHSALLCPLPWQWQADISQSWGHYEYLLSLSSIKTMMLAFQRFYMMAYLNKYSYMKLTDWN